MSNLPNKVFRRLALSRSPAGVRRLRTSSTLLSTSYASLQQHSPAPLRPPLQQQLQQQQWRSMVVITKTSSSDPALDVSKSDTSAPPVNVDTTTLVNSDERLTITPSCVKQIHALLKRRDKSPDEMFLRVFVDAGGCSGFTYQFELDDELVEDEDVIFAPEGANGARVVVDEASLNLIQGSKIDYVQEMIKSAFVVNDNPQSESACGCGSSFAVKNFAANPALD